MGFLFEAGYVVALEVVTLSIALGPRLLAWEEGCPLWLSPQQSTCWHPLPLLSCGHMGDSGGCESAILKARWLFLSSLLGYAIKLG